jgi:hypothetical protein
LTYAQTFLTLKADQKKRAPTYKSELDPRFQKYKPGRGPPHGNAPPSTETRCLRPAFPEKRPQRAGKTGSTDPRSQRKRAGNTAPRPMFPPCFRRNKATEPCFRGNKTPSRGKRCREPCFYIKLFISRLLHEINSKISSKQAETPGIVILTDFLVHLALAALRAAPPRRSSPSC